MTTFKDFKEATESIIRFMEEKNADKVVSVSFEDKGDYTQLRVDYTNNEGQKKNAGIRIKKEGIALPPDTLVEIKHP